MAILFEKDDAKIVTLTIDMPGKSVNTLGADFMCAFHEAVDRLEKENFIGVIITSAKNDFLAGADVDELFAATDPARVLAQSNVFKECVRRLETMGKPIVAALNGSALGGGYELALACHHRVALHNPKSRIGLPECSLGLFPGGGGTQRLPRLIGVQPALDIILEGKQLKVDQALYAGLVDAVAENKEEMLAQAIAWIKNHPESSQPWDRKDYRWPGGHPMSGSNAPLWGIAPSAMNKKARGNYVSRNDALCAVYEGANVDLDTGSRIESRYFAHTVCDQTSKNMLTAFWYQLNAIKKGASRPQDQAPSQVKKIGILGAGMMGAGIAYASAISGIDVVLSDVSLEQADKGKAYSQKLLEKQVKKGRRTPEYLEGVLAKIKTTEAAADLEGCDLIIEAVFENRDLKAKVTAEAEAVIPKDAVFASNTSTLPITGLAEASSRPANFIGLHFFSPVDRMPLVEIIVGKETSPATLARAFDFVLQIRKTPIVVNDSRGFYTSRVFGTYVKEGIALLAEGQHPRAIESAGLQAGMPVGPLAVSDEVSLSLSLLILEQTRKDLAAAGIPIPTHPSDVVFEKMVRELDRPGKKAGRGFYEYPEQGRKFLWGGLEEVFPRAKQQLDQEEMMHRMMFAQVIETVRCYEEGVLTQVADANLGSIFGWGFAPFKGGTLQYVNDFGVAAFVDRARELEAKYGARFCPPKLLVEMAEKGETF